MVAISGSREWSRAGAFRQTGVNEDWLLPTTPATFSEILSLSLHGFVCERALALDLTPPPAPLPAAPAAEPVPVAEWEPALCERRPASAEDGLGANQLPRIQRAQAPVLAWETAPSDWRRNWERFPILPALQVTEPLGRLPAIDWTAERLDQMAAQNEPGMVRLRSPRARSPQMARLVKPAAGSSGPPIRVRPTVRPPKTSPFRLFKLAMPSGAKVPLRFDTPVAGMRVQLAICEPPLAFAVAIQPASRARREWKPNIGLSGLRALDLSPLPGWATAGTNTSELTPARSRSLSMPRGPFVRGNEFDPPSCGMVRLSLEIKPHRAPVSVLAAPPLRPLVSYRWAPVKPELIVGPIADWAQARHSLAPLSLTASAPQPAPVAVPAGHGEPLTAAPLPSFSNLRLVSNTLARPSHPMAANRMVPISLEDCEAKEGKAEPKSRLEQIAPQLSHQHRKSALRTVADWELSRWSSASMYGSALWRIAIGRFSGALDQAPKVVRWVAAVAALALGAFAIYPGSGPAVPADEGWTIANNPGTAATETRAAAPPPPRRIKAPPPPPRTVVARAVKPARAEPSAAPTSGGLSLTSAWGNVQRHIAERAAVAFTDDFRNGLAEWEGAGDWARSWSYDASGFVRTGGLALLAPARDLTDYRMEFLGQIERHSMGWVVRAADLRNYYALKLTIVADGPVPEVALIRYPVINGMAGAASQQMLPIEVRGDTVYRVQTEVRGDYFAVTVQGKIVDSWTDARLKRGSIGLFSGKGELARVRWVGVWHQYDTLGRLCALLAPGGLPGRERGANQ